MAPVEGSQRYSQPACHHLSRKLGNYNELINDYLVGEDLKMRVTSFLHCSIDGMEYFGTFPRRRFRSSSGTMALSNINVSFKVSLATPTCSRHQTGQTRSSTDGLDFTLMLYPSPIIADTASESMESMRAIVAASISDAWVAATLHKHL